nr:beta-eliminating lyase-related protein [Fodinicola feengrottensis]
MVTRQRRDEVRRASERFLQMHGPTVMADQLTDLASRARGRDRDSYGTGELIEELEGRLADLFGTEAAVFLPSGTMAQQIALRIWAEQAGRDTVGLHPLTHLEVHELGAVWELHRLRPRFLTRRTAPTHPRRPGRGRGAAGQRGGRASVAGGRFPAADLGRVVGFRGGGGRTWCASACRRCQIVGKHGTPGPFAGRDRRTRRQRLRVVLQSPRRDVRLRPGRSGILCRPGSPLAAPPRRNAVRTISSRVGRTARTRRIPAAGADLCLVRPKTGCPPRRTSARTRQPESRPTHTNGFAVYVDADSDRLDEATVAYAQREKKTTTFWWGPTVVPGWSKTEISVGEATLGWKPGEIADTLQELVDRAS